MRRIYFEKIDLSVPEGSSDMKALYHRKYSLLLACILCVSPASVWAQPLANGQSKFLGNVLDTYSVYSNFTSLWNELTPGNAGKWGSVEYSQGQYSWSTLDNYYNFAFSNRIVYKHHNLIWGNQQPSWISSLDSSTQRAEVKKWIDTLAQRYTSTQIVDVVNEPFHAPPDGSNGSANYIKALGGSGATGWDWVVTAFQMARNAYFSDTKLLINDYNILQDNNVTTNYIKLIDTLQVRGLIDGIGIQGHYFEFRSPVAATSGTYVYDVNTIKANLNRLATTGLPIYITEFEINEPVDSVQLAQCKIYFPIFWSNPAVKGMTLWGYMQGDMWKVDAYLVRSDGSERPAMQWMRIYVATPAVVSPVGLTNQPRDASLIWHKSAPATSYRVQVATDSAFASVVADTTVTDTLVHLSPLAAFTSYYWHVSAVDSMGASLSSVASPFTTGNQILAVENTDNPPRDFQLSQNYPNPFNPSTTIGYELPKSAYVSLRVYDALGRLVATLVDGVQAARDYKIQWDGSAVSSGVYFCRMFAHSLDGSAHFVSVKKLVLMK